MTNSVAGKQALLRGHLTVNVPVMAIMFSPWLLTWWAFENIIYFQNFFSNRILEIIKTGLVGLSVFSIPLAWLYWAIAVPRWKLWAYSKVKNVAALKEEAITEGLIWPDGHILGKTEICSSAMRKQLLKLEGAYLTYTFRRLTAADLPLVNGWIETPHVAEWWIEADGTSEPLDETLFDEPDFNAWIVSLHGRPFAYMQDYNPHLYPDHHFFDRPPGTRGIDQFIGEADMLNKGHGSAFVRQHIETLFASGAPVVVTDPAPTNPRAIRAYEKAGFTVYGEIISPTWGPSLLMQCVK